ncbi:hypothetical protein [uncultured Nostoc sp.]|uniref:lectin OAA family protein n=1 Tax=uncultured Nostoc sp. TaxID=340711 RepID=UPI0035CC15CD
MPIYQVKNQWGGSSAPWHEAGRWTFGDRSEQNVVAINVKSDDDGETLNGTMTYKGEGPIGFRASRYINNVYRIENQWGGDSAPWHPGNYPWELGDRDNTQHLVAIDVKSEDGGQTLNGTITYKGEGPIGFQGVWVEAGIHIYEVYEENEDATDIQTRGTAAL